MPDDTTALPGDLARPDAAGGDLTPNSPLGADGGVGNGGGSRGRHVGRAWWKSPWAIAGAAALVVLGGVGIALAVTSGGTKAKVAAPTTTVAPTTTKAPAPACPLNGGPSPSGSVPQRPALAVKVDNYPDARPQSGLDEADIIFEEPVEGGITRYVAVFQCRDAAQVGPIRSTRYPDSGILEQLSKPIFIHVGGIDPIVGMLTQAQSQGLLFDFNFFYDASIIQHVPGRNAPFNIYVSTADAWKSQPKDTNPPAPVFTYSATAPAGTTTASVHIPFSPTSDENWTWNPTGGVWMLAYSGIQATLLGGGPVGMTNVVIQSVQTSYGPWLENSAYNSNEIEVNALSGGTVTVLRNGVAVTGKWTRASLTAPIVLVAADGSPIPLAPGPTWVAMVPSQIPVTPTP